MNMHKKRKLTDTHTLLQQRQTTGKPTNNKIIHNQIAHGLHSSHDLLGHFGCVNTVAFSRDESLLCTGSDDERVLIWNVGRGAGTDSSSSSSSSNKTPKSHIQALKGHFSNIFCAVFGSTNSRILSCGNDHRIIYHDTERATPIQTIDYHTASVYKVSFCPTSDNLFLSASEDRSVCLWDIRDTRRPVGSLHSSGPFNSVDFNPVDQLFVTASSKQGVQLWDARMSLDAKWLRTLGCTPLMQYNGTTKHVSGANFNSDGSQIIASVRQGPPTLYNTPEEDPVCVFLDPQYQNSCTMKSCSFIGNYDEYVVSGSDDFRIYIWAIPTSEHNNTNNNNTTNYNENNNNNNNNSKNNKKRKTSNPELYSKKPPLAAYGTDVTVDKVTTILLGHRSIVNNLRWNKAFGILVSSGVEKIVKVWSTIADDKPTVCIKTEKDPIISKMSTSE